MTTNITSSNPVVQKIISGAAPPAAQMMAARGMLPLPAGDLMEVLVYLRGSESEAVKAAADETLAAQDMQSLLDIAQGAEAAPTVLEYLATNDRASRAVHEAVTLNLKTPDAAIVRLASATTDPALLELISTNQQRLIRLPAIGDAVLANTLRTPQAERRVREVQKEFFEKERGAQQIASELRARGNEAAAEFLEQAESFGADETLTDDDAWLIASHIEVTDDEIDDSWLPSERLEEIFAETEEYRLANAERILAETSAEAGGIAPERVSLIRRVMLMNVKDRVKLAMKGDREARAILIRDANKMVSVAVINNPRVTDQEIESITAMRTVSDEVLRLIAMSRQWSRSYAITHNLARNPRTPIATAMGILPRIRAKDLEVMSKSKNVAETVRRQAYRLSQARAGR
ncbi:MAG: hypothetical protein MSG64_00350 [Pyrinomonadaceae bacterium MAG19_C2-C3]|nr:hypothetical protein [Pyrinomonadaceae bacterium MAG19_C2-C3]